MDVSSSLHKLDLLESLSFIILYNLCFSSSKPKFKKGPFTIFVTVYLILLIISLTFSSSYLSLGSFYIYGVNILIFSYKDACVVHKSTN
jgi:prepilin signal peptidase PulO-like enzyme (type II secretory pathway)